MVLEGDEGIIISSIIPGRDHLPRTSSSYGSVPEGRLKIPKPHRPGAPLGSVFK